jgi:hypothetical protein
LHEVQFGELHGERSIVSSTVSVYHRHLAWKGAVMIRAFMTFTAGQEKNWINTKGWFPIFRFYGPLPPLYDKSWKLPDIEMVK